MRTKVLSLALAAVPSILAAQSGGASGSGSGSGSASSSSSGSGSAQTQSGQVTSSSSANAAAQGQLTIPASFSAEARTRLQSVYDRAQKSNVPTQPISQRVAEGQAKGATEGAIVASATRVEGNLETTHELMVSAGRKPTAAETASGANAMDRGVTRAQLQAMIAHTQQDRSLTVAFNVLSQLTASGVPVTDALSQVQAKLDAGAPDAAISALGTISVGGSTGRRGGGF
ncbi:MAG TPA: hypothetical protein VE967_13850 [Gemmatimonadaceae bacterium]|nr:hypothetical protein [Gemmatimonadaceae bacterium]